MKTEIVVCPGRKGHAPIVIKTEKIQALDHRHYKESWKGAQGGRVVSITLPRIDALREAR